MKHYILCNENALYYECGYSCDNAIYLRMGDEAYFITDGRYTTDAKAQVKGAEVLTSADIVAEARKRIKKAVPKRIAFDPKEWDLFRFEKLTRKLKTRFVAKPDFSHKKRIIKRHDEIALLDEAVRRGAKAFKKFGRWLEERGDGKRETKLAFRAAAFLSDKGRYDLSFDPIVAINANAAKPHAVPSAERLHKGDLLLLDAGLKYKRYCSDRTRTVHFQEGFRFDYAQRFGDKTIQRAYDAVRKAHDRAIAKARSGMKAKQIDAIARETIEKAGFGSYFVHSTGHGVGLDIHEMPYISQRSDTLIEDGMVFTIEPGIYLPDRFGIRIEDMVVMQNGRAEVLGL